MEPEKIWMVTHIATNAVLGIFSNKLEAIKGFKLFFDRDEMELITDIDKINLVDFKTETIRVRLQGKIELLHLHYTYLNNSAGFIALKIKDY